nr:MAG TPA: hypothetical protein [Caudoviricetes sp.]
MFWIPTGLTSFLRFVGTRFILPTFCRLSTIIYSDFPTFCRQHLFGRVLFA